MKMQKIIGAVAWLMLVAAVPLCARAGFIDETGYLSYGFVDSSSSDAVRVFGRDNTNDTITKVVIPSSVVYEYTVYDNEDKEYKTLRRTCEVVEIGSSAFYNYTALTAVTFNETITNIGSHAFGNCVSLKSVQLPNTLISIGSGAFTRCNALKTFKTPLSLKRLGSSALSGCLALETAEIDGNGLYVEYCTFSGCTNLKSVVYGEGVAVIEGGKLFNSQYVFKNCSSLESIEVKSLAIRSVPEYFCNVPSLKTISFAGVITNIGWGAFYDCSGLERIYGTIRPKRIGYGAFNDCTSLDSQIDFSDCTSIGSGAFQNCRSMSGSLSLPKLDSIKSSTFQGCESLTSVTFSDSLTNIESQAFAECKSFKTFKTPASLKTIEANVLMDCTSLETAEIDGNELVVGIMFNGCERLHTVVYGNGVASMKGGWIGGMGGRFYDFTGCTSLVSIVVKSTAVRDIPKIFCKQPSLKTLSFAGCITNIGADALSGCSGLERIYGTLKPVSIGDCAFLDCRSLDAQFDFSDCTYIGGSAFSNCRSLSGSLSLPKLDVIPGNAFYYCSSLTDVSLKGVESIGDNAFEGCHSLQKVTDIDCATNIGSRAFLQCTSLTNVFFESVPPARVGQTAFFQAKQSRCLGFYRAKHKTEWEAVIDEDGTWERLVMRCLGNAESDGGEGEGEGDGKDDEVGRYTVRYNPNGDDDYPVIATQPMADQQFNIGEEKELIPNKFVRTGFEFGGWIKSPKMIVKNYSDCQKVKDLSDEDGEVVDLYALWIPKRVKITFDANASFHNFSGATHFLLVGSVFQRYLYSVYTTNDGVEFVGWYTEPVYGTKLVAGKTRVPATDTTYYGHWIIDEQPPDGENPPGGCKPPAYDEEGSYLVYFNPNGGTMNENDVARVVAEGTPIGSLPDAFMDGYDLDGWYTAATGGMRIVESLLITSNMTCYAHWRKLSGAMNGNGYIRNVTAKQRFPWNGKVDIRFEVVGDISSIKPGVTPILDVSAMDTASGVNWTADKLIGDIGSEEGWHEVVWDLDAQGLDAYSSNFVFTVRYNGSVATNANSSSVGKYCVIDLSGGISATNYPVSYFESEPEGGWTDEYKTSKLVLRRVEPGTFLMGDVPASNAVEVTIKTPFYMGVFEVTQKQYGLVTGSQPSQIKGNMMPVDYVSWQKIRGSKNWPTDRSVAESSFIGILQAKTGLNFDLPTEAQWEYACRSGTSTVYYWGDSMNGDYAWYFENSTNQINIVGVKLPNAWGLYDMIGNAYEWCLDWYQNTLPGGTDPVGFSSGRGRVFRGGSGTNYADSCTSSSRFFSSPMHGYGNYGFRLSRTLIELELGQSKNTDEVEFVQGVEGSVELLCEDSSPKTLIDMRDEPVVDAAQIVYNAEWIGGDSNSVVLITDNDNELQWLSGKGEFSWIPSVPGKHILKYMTYIDGELQDEIYTAILHSNKESGGIVPGEPGSEDEVTGSEFDFEWTAKDGKVTVTRYIGTNSVVEIPSIISNMPVVVVGDGTFEGYTPLEQVIIPEGVTNIEVAAFSGCTSLFSVKIPDSVIHIARTSFDRTPFGDRIFSETFKATAQKIWREDDTESGKDCNNSSSINIVVTNVVVHYVLNSISPEIAVPDVGEMGFVAIVPEIKGGALSVPVEWRDSYPGFSSKYGSDFASALTKLTGKRDAQGNALMVWHDYVAGTNPMDETDIFTASITMVDGKPKISYSPELNEEEKAKRKYTVYGKVRLQDEEWKVVVDDISDYNFFKVSVEMK